jgi:hypothetical protein
LIDLLSLKDICLLGLSPQLGLENMPPDSMTSDMRSAVSDQTVCTGQDSRTPETPIVSITSDMSHTSDAVDPIPTFVHYDYSTYRPNYGPTTDLFPVDYETRLSLPHPPPSIALPVTPSRNFHSDHLPPVHHNDELFRDLMNMEGTYQRFPQNRFKPHCSLCASVVKQSEYCALCALEADFIDETTMPLVRFGSNIVHRYDPDSIIEEPLFEAPTLPEDGITLSNETNLLNLGSRSNLNEEDRRLSEIVNSYFHTDPPKETLAQKLKGKVSTLSASLHRSKNPFIGSNDEEIFSAFENLYQQSVFEDLSVCDDPYERVLKIFRDHSNWPQFSDKKLFLNCCQAMRLRVSDKPDVYMTVC